MGSFGSREDTAVRTGRLIDPSDDYSGKPRASSWRGSLSEVRFELWQTPPHCFFSLIRSLQERDLWKHCSPGGFKSCPSVLTRADLIDILIESKSDKMLYQPLWTALFLLLAVVSPVFAYGDCEDAASNSVLSIHSSDHDSASNSPTACAAKYSFL